VGSIAFVLYELQQRLGRYSWKRLHVKVSACNRPFLIKNCNLFRVTIDGAPAAGV
jgi:hypothetical protein